MSKLLIIGFLLIATTAVVGTLSLQDKAKIEQLEKSKDRGKLEWYAAMAKAKGNKRIVFRSPIVMYSVPRTLDEALKHYDVVIAESIQSQSFSTVEDITTWYKFRIVEDLSTATVVCSSCPRVSNVPQEMMPLGSGEFLAAKNGGEVVIDGVNVISYDADFPSFEIGKRYLLFLSFNREKMIGFLETGPWGAYQVTFDDRLEAVDKKLKHPLDEEISNRFKNSLGELRRRTRESIKTK